MAVKTPVKIGLLVAACLMVIALTLQVFGSGQKAGDDSGATLKVGKTETRNNLSSTCVTSSSDGSTFSARRVLLFSDNPHPLNREIVARLSQQLKDCPLIEFLEVTNRPFTLTNGAGTPDLFLNVNLVKLDQEGIVSTTMKSLVAASLGNTPWQSSSHTIDSSTPPLVSFQWNATEESETTFTGLRTDRYADTARSIADELAKAIRKQIEELSDKHPRLPGLPEEFYGPYQPVADFDGLKQLQARRAASYCGLFTHNQTFWQFQTATNPVPQLERLIRELTASGWIFSDVQLTNTLAWRAHGKQGGAELEIFRHRRGGMNLSLDEDKQTHLDFIAHYRQPFSREEREAALDKLFAGEQSVETLLPFRNSFSSAQRQKFFERVEKDPVTSPQACVQLAEHYLQRKRTNDSIRLLIRAKALTATLKEPASLQSNIEGVAKKISPKKELELEVTPEICRELGFLELTNAPPIIGQNRGFDQPLVFFGPGKHGLKIYSLMVGSPQKETYPWRFVQSEDGVRSSSWSSFNPSSRGDWQHSFTFDGQQLKVTAIPLPDQKQVKFTVEAGD
jgi:hypothetical protein